MVWVVTECQFGAEITEVVGVATSEERGREIAEEHWAAQAKRVGPMGDRDGQLLWDEQGSYYMMCGRRFSSPYDVAEFPVL